LHVAERQGRHHLQAESRKNDDRDKENDKQVNSMMRLA